MMTEEDRKKVIGHALDHVAYRWSPYLPVRHDRREWTAEEIGLYNETYKKANKELTDKLVANGTIIMV